MAWTTPLTAVTGVALTAAQWNASVRDDLNVTAPAVATTAGRLIVASGANAVAERAILRAFVDTQETTTSVTYAALTTPGPAVTLTTGASAIQFIESKQGNQTGATATFASYAVSGATTIAAADNIALQFRSPNANDFLRCSVVDMNFGSLTGGSNTFTMQYEVSSGTGFFAQRKIIVMAL
jgi:hypothetical protein